MALESDGATRWAKPLRWMCSTHTAGTHTHTHMNRGEAKKCNEWNVNAFLIEVLGHPSKQNQPTRPIPSLVPSLPSPSCAQPASADPISMLEFVVSLNRTLHVHPKPHAPPKHCHLLLFNLFYAVCVFFRLFSRCFLSFFRLTLVITIWIFMARHFSHAKYVEVKNIFFVSISTFLFFVRHVFFGTLTRLSPAFNGRRYALIMLYDVPLYKANGVSLLSFSPSLSLALLLFHFRS